VGVEEVEEGEEGPVPVLLVPAQELIGDRSGVLSVQGLVVPQNAPEEVAPGQAPAEGRAEEGLGQGYR